MNEKVKIIIGLKLKELRLKHKLTLKEVADKIGKTPKTIQLYETGVINISLEVFIDLCKLYNISPNELLETIIRFD